MNNETSRTKKLYRSRTEKIFAGVCGGLADFFDTDPTLVRIIFVLLALLNGIGLILYLALMIIVPKEPVAGSLAEEAGKKEKIEEFVEEIKNHAKSFRGEMNRNGRSEQRRNIIGIILIVFGFLFLLQNIMPFRFLHWSFFWPLILIVIGFSILFRDSDEKENGQK